LLGTNPLAIAVPAESGPFLLDIATTAASHGTIKVVREAGGRLPEGWVVDRDGHPVTDPARAEDGFLVPMGGYKGAGLTVAIGLLAGVLNGAAFGSSVVDHRLDEVTPTNTGQLLVVLRADLFRPLVEVLGGVEQALEELRTSDGPGAPRLRLPGDASQEAWQRSLAEGVDIPETLLTKLHDEARKCRFDQFL
jgi:LDH2 family malate/lactate/ureidoglycolate dehydrogenase